MGEVSVLQVGELSALLDELKEEYKFCNYGGTSKAGKIIALSDHAGTKQACFLFKGEKMGIWVPISSLTNKPSTISEQSTPINPNFESVKAEASETAWNSLSGWVNESILGLDLISASKSIDKLRQRSKKKSSFQLAQTVILHKSLQIAGITAVKAMPKAEQIIQNLVGVGLPDIAKISAEMVYQIALIYGVVDDSTSIQSDIMMTFGITLQINKKIELGINLLQQGKLTSTVLSASAKALMIHAIGHTACIYYANRSANLATLREEAQSYLDGKNSEEAVIALIDSEIAEVYSNTDYSELSKYLE